MKYKYQLVIQFPMLGLGRLDINRLVEFEQQLKNGNSKYFLDGNEIGSGEMNVFLFTNEPQGALDVIKPLIPSRFVWRAAYRFLAEGSEYEILYPEGLKEFSVA